MRDEKEERKKEASKVKQTCVHVQEYLRACSTLYLRLCFVQKVKKLNKQLKSASEMIQNQQ